MALKAEVLVELEALTEGEDSDLLSELVCMFEGNAASLTRAMRTALATKNCKEFERAAHSLKGSAAGLGLDQSAEICFQLEQQGRQLKLDGCEAIIEKAEKELTGDIVLLKEYLITRKQNVH